MKASGIGREMGHQGIEAYTEIKGIWTGFASASAASTTPTQA
jgi:acyl-CoA reductase-like NAD-dependent aldehyde dehydrogenase